MTLGPPNVLDANDGQTRVMGCEEQAGGGRGGGREEGGWGAGASQKLSGTLRSLLHRPPRLLPTRGSAWPSETTDLKPQGLYSGGEGKGCAPSPCPGLARAWGPEGSGGTRAQSGGLLCTTPRRQGRASVPRG